VTRTSPPGGRPRIARTCRYSRALSAGTGDGGCLALLRRGSRTLRRFLAGDLPNQRCRTNRDAAGTWRPDLSSPGVSAPTWYGGVVERRAREFAADTPGCVASGTFYLEPSVDRYVREALEAGTRIFKMHVQFGEFDPADRELDRVRGLLADAATPVVVHCGNGPSSGRHTGRSLCRLCCAGTRS
jgi:hypothetical protein